MSVASNTTNPSPTGDRIIQIRNGESCPDGWEIAHVINEHVEHPGANGDGSGDGGPVTVYTVVIRLKPFVPLQHVPFGPPYLDPVPWTPYWGDPNRITCETCGEVHPLLTLVLD